MSASSLKPELQMMRGTWNTVFWCQPETWSPNWHFRTQVTNPFTSIINWYQLLISTLRSKNPLKFTNSEIYLATDCLLNQVLLRSTRNQGAIFCGDQAHCLWQRSTKLHWKHLNKKVWAKIHQRLAFLHKHHQKSTKTKHLMSITRNQAVNWLQALETFIARAATNVHFW